eukprot:9318847-Pyramimonas_sp.AAC.1
MADGGVRCWGDARWGTCGPPNTNLRTYGETELVVPSGPRLGQDYVGDQPGEMPPLPLDLGGSAKAVSAGGVHACAVMEDLSVKCWGDNRCAEGIYP